MMRVRASFMAGVCLCLMAFSPAFADASLQPVKAAGRFLPLPERAVAQQGQRMALQPAHFMALAPRAPMIQPAVATRRAGPADEEAELPVIPVSDSHALMSREQAEQIISLFEPDQ